MKTTIETYPLNETKVTLNGKYWVGDPCYIFPEDDTLWQEFINKIYPKFNKPLFDDTNTIRVLKVNKHICYTFGTAYGDGSYYLKKSGKRIKLLGVDAGMLAVVPMKLVNTDGWGIASEHGAIISFNNETLPIGVDGGDFFLGTYSINTSGDEPDFDDEDYA